jgi:hypothetical protein
MEEFIIHLPFKVAGQMKDVAKNPKASLMSRVEA